MLNALLLQAVTRAAPNDGAVVWALLGIISTLTATVGLFIRSVLKERDYWRSAFFEEQAQKREMLVTGQVVRSVVRALPTAADAGPPGDGGGSS